jgi:hypothetical protein
MWSKNSCMHAQPVQQSNYAAMRLQCVSCSMALSISWQDHFAPCNRYVLDI